MTLRPNAPLSGEVLGTIAAGIGNALGLMLYGSHARGDADSSSDIDLLQLVSAAPSTSRRGRATIVSYTPRQLREMTEGGSLFAWHLRTEGIILGDPEGLVAQILSDHPGPATHYVLKRVCELAAVLDVQESEFDDYGTGLLRTGRYLLRSALYGRSLAAGETSFSVAAAAATLGAQEYLPLLRRGDLQKEWPALASYKDAIARLADSQLATNSFGSLEALAVNTWECDRALAVIAIQAMSTDGLEIDYATLPAPVL